MEDKFISVVKAGDKVGCLEVTPSGTKKPLYGQQN